jgi:hypothetical protein
LSPALIAVIAAFATGMVSLIGAILLGKLVPASRVTEATAASLAEATASRVEAEKWRLAYEEKSKALDNLETVVERQRIVTDTVNQVLAAIKSTAQTPLPPYQVGGST